MTLAEIEAAADALPPEDQARLLAHLASKLGVRNDSVSLLANDRWSVLDIPSVSVGQILAPLSPDDDFLGEMLEEKL